ncbi:DUF1036 domain-containing protein [Coralliovum pocilloporae]|uniref:DUF1036 domain-containing protein n=1 Tax=Coralliovum pocilloporae TaxID=3066369 RepID=UPI0033072949
MVRKSTHVALLVCLFGLGLVSMPSASEAGLRLCNKTTSRIGVAIGYRGDTDWVTEGWWNLPPSECGVLLPDPLLARYYYVYAVDYDLGGEWGGRRFMCIKDKEFVINGLRDCTVRGFKRAGFFEIDTGEQKNWTVQLGEPDAGNGNSQ